MHEDKEACKRSFILSANSGARQPQNVPLSHFLCTALRNKALSPSCLLHSLYYQKSMVICWSIMQHTSRIWTPLCQKLHKQGRKENPCSRKLAVLRIMYAKLQNTNGLDQYGICYVFPCFGPYGKQGVDSVH